MIWGPLPPSTLNVPIRRETFIDITVSGSATIGGTIRGGDIISTNWDGTIPLDLSGGADAGASEGYALDGSEGAIQVQTLYAEGGEIGNLSIVNALTLQTGGAIRTASSGQRIEITEDERDRIRLFTGEETEAISGVLRAGSFGEDGTLVLYSSLYAPTNDNDATNTTYLQIRSPSDDDSSVAPGINLAYGGSSAQAPELQLQNNFSIRVIDGDVWIEDGILQVPAIEGLPWQTWTPALTNMSKGNGTVIARYKQIGDTVHFYFRFTLGSSSTVGGATGISLPVTAASEIPDMKNDIGGCLFADATGVWYPGHIELVNTTTFKPRAIDPSAAYSPLADITASVPFTWATNDVMTLSGTYEAA